MSKPNWENRIAWTGHNLDTMHGNLSSSAN